MAQNITIQGASYSDVPSVTLPKTGGGTAYFTDVTPTTATEEDVASGKIFYKADGSQTVGSHVDSGITTEQLNVSAAGTYTAPTGTAYNPVVVPSGSVAVDSVYLDGSDLYMSASVNSSGLVTYTAQYQGYTDATVSSGYVSDFTSGLLEVGASKTYQLPTQGATTITPTTIDQTIPSGKYLTGSQTIKGDANLVPANIANGVTIFGVTGTHSGSGVSVVVTQDVHGGDIVTITGEEVTPYNPFGEAAEVIATYEKQTYALKDTLYNTWTPSTTAKTIVATANLGTQALDLANYEYFTKFVVDSRTVYNDGTTIKGGVVHQVTAIWQYIYRKPSNLTNLASKTDNYNYCTTIYTAPLMDYYNVSGTRTMAYTGSYGLYGAATAHTFNNSTSTTPTLTIKRPVLNARCSNSYFTTAMAAAVDKDNSTISVWGGLYRCKKGSFGRAVWDDLISVYNS